MSVRTTATEAPITEPQTLDVEAVETGELADADDDTEFFGKRAVGEMHKAGQMGARRIGSLAIGIGVVGIVLNQMSSLDIVANSTGVVDVSNIFNIAGSGLSLLVIGVIVAAASVLLSLWGDF